MILLAHFKVKIPHSHSFTHNQNCLIAQPCNLGWHSQQGEEGLPGQILCSLSRQPLWSGLILEYLPAACPDGQSMYVPGYPHGPAQLPGPCLTPGPVLSLCWLPPLLKEPGCLEQEAKWALPTK